MTQADRGRAFRDRRVGVALYDLHGDRAHLDQDNQRLREFWPLLAPAQFAVELVRTAGAVAGLLTRMDGVALDFAARTLALPLGWVRAAFEHLQHSGKYAMDDLPKMGLVLMKRG